MAQSANRVPQFGHFVDFQNDLHELHSGNPVWHFLHTAVAATNEDPHFAHFP
ncbi:MAG: hypothetical protein ACTSUE_02590 [Promethearchaeota archaeon]